MNKKQLEFEEQWENMGEALANDIITQEEYDRWLEKVGCKKCTLNVEESVDLEQHGVVAVEKE